MVRIMTALPSILFVTKNTVYSLSFFSIHFLSLCYPFAIPSFSNRSIITRCSIHLPNRAMHEVVFPVRLKKKKFETYFEAVNKYREKLRNVRIGTCIALKRFWHISDKKFRWPPFCDFFFSYNFKVTIRYYLIISPKLTHEPSSQLKSSLEQALNKTINTILKDYRPGFSLGFLYMP